MPYINLPKEIPGIRSLFQFRPQTAGPLLQLAQTLLRGPSSLSIAERELLAAHVSNRNNCAFCTASHAAAARHLFAADSTIVDDVLANGAGAAISPRMQALLTIAGKVRILGKEVSESDVDAARSAGADEVAIHDAVLIAAAFSMFNRYVDGLGTVPAADDAYADMGERMATDGYRL